MVVLPDPEGAENMISLPFTRTILAIDFGNDCI